MHWTMTLHNLVIVCCKVLTNYVDSNAVQILLLKIITIKLKQQILIIQRKNLWIFIACKFEECNNKYECRSPKFMVLTPKFKYICNVLFRTQLLFVLPSSRMYVAKIYDLTHFENTLKSYVANFCEASNFLSFVRVKLYRGFVFGPIGGLFREII